MGYQEQEQSLNQKPNIDTAVDYSDDTYRLLMSGGRIKASSISPSVLYAASREYMLEPGLETAYNATRNFDALRKKPPRSILVSFFPLDRQTIQQNIRGAGLYRPFLKTDQGPAGNFTGFTFADKDSRQLQITDEYGYVIPEVYLYGEVTAHPEAEQMTNIITEIDWAYRQGNYADCYQLIQIFKEKCEALGIRSDRTADVGREAFFFCRPVSTEPSATLPSTLQSDIEARVNDVVRRIEARSQMIRYYTRQDVNIEKAVKLADRDSDFEPEENPTLAYFQADVFVGKSGEVIVDKLQLPDVGFFLTALDPRGNPQIERVQGINNQLLVEAVSAITSAVEGKDSLTIVIRDEVFRYREDTLELLEVDVLTKALQERGLQVEVASLTEIVKIPNGNLLLLLNLKAEDPAYQELLAQVAHGEKKCFPDPFVQLSSHEATDLRRIIIEELHLSKFLEAVRPIKGGFTQKNADHRMRTINNILTGAGIEEDIIYFDIPGEYASIPTFRYSPHSFAQIYNAVVRQEKLGNKVNSIIVKPIPFDPEDQRVIGEDGPRLAAFRTMFVRR